MIKISVIVPVYNSERFLNKCLTSLVNQTFKDLEIICINDGSPDNSQEILEKFAQQDSRIKVIKQERFGPSICRNLGIDIAQGEYISFVDSDDWIDETFYEKLHEAAKKYDADIAACGIKRHRSYKYKYHLKIMEEKCTEDITEKFRLCDVPEKCYVWNKIYKLDKLKENHIEFEPHVYYEDRMFTVESLYNLRRLVVVPDVYYNYWTNSNSIVKTKSPKKDMDSVYTRRKMYEFIKEHNILADCFSNIKKVKIFGLTVLKVKMFDKKNEYLLFNHIKWQQTF